MNDAKKTVGWLEWMSHAALAVAALAAVTDAAAGTVTWTGAGANALASNSANWDTGAVPATGDDVVLDATGSAKDMTWDAAMSGVVPASWTQSGYEGKVTFATVFDTNGFSSVEISGDVVLNSGSWTHQNNTGSAKTYRLHVVCGGNFTIGANGSINVTGLGYRNKIAINGHSDSGTQGGSYGGHGGMATAQETWTYGSLFAPVELGNAGNAPSGADCSGGGAIRLAIAGAFTHNGTITANGVAVNYTYYGGAGGSIFITAASISGTGTMSADSPNVNISGSGGRIAVKLSGEGADFSHYDMTNLVSCASLKKDKNTGGCGTIYAETAADGAGHGWLILKGNGTEPTDKLIYYADPFSHEVTSANFSRISILGKTKLCLRTGYTLDVTGTAFDIGAAGYGIVMNGGRIITRNGAGFAVPFALSAKAAATFDVGSLTLRNGGSLASDFPVTVTGSLTVESGATITTSTGAAQAPTHSLSLSVGGDMAVESGGSVTVAGKGYAKGYGPNGSIANYNGGSHGGQGIYNNSTTPTLSSVAPYGSAINPVTHGSAGGNSSNGGAGGGVARLAVAGGLRVDGTISADAAACTWYPGAGGSLNITAASLSGAATGILSANGGTASSNNRASGGGGRIAIRLTGANAGFSQYLGTITAYGRGYTGSSSYRRGGAGTVYLQTAAQGEGGGDLVIDNGAADSSGPTPIGGSIDGSSFGSVTISHKVNLVLADGAAISVAGNFANGAAFTAGTDSAVSFTGGGTSAISGNNTFCNLSCLAPGKTLAFAAGSTTTVSGLFSVSGDGSSYVSLASGVAGESWTLNAAAASISAAAVRDCASATEIEVVNGQDLGGNNANVRFTTIVAANAVWTGVRDGTWSDAGNWDIGRVPLLIDTVIIPATATGPTLDMGVKVGTMTIQSGATLNIADKTLEVVGDLTALGAIASSGGTLLISGTSAQAVSATSLAIDKLALLGTATTLSGTYSCYELVIGDGSTPIDCAFSAGTEIEATLLTVNGSAGQPNVVLHPVASGGTWSIDASRSSVTGAAVSGSDASGGAAIIPVACVDNGGNVNWLFNDTRLRWTGANGTDFADGSNWQGGQAPTSADEVVIDIPGAVTLAAPATVAALTVGGGATFTANAALNVSGALVGEDGGAFVLNRPVTVGGNLVLLDGATITHDVNKGAETSKIDITVAGTGYIAQGAKIDAKGKGYYAVNNVSTYQRGPGLNSKSNVNKGASHGGQGYHQGVLAAVPCYGSITNPVAIGSGGGYGGNGGGAVILRFGGAFRLDGEIDADAENSTQSYYCGSGGSVNIRAAALAGSGSAHAGGGSSACVLPGGGGRLAVTLTEPGARLADFSGSLTAYGGYTDHKIGSSAGTVYLREPGDACGTVRIANDSFSALYLASNFTSLDGTDFPRTQDNDWKEVRGVRVEVGRYATLFLTADARVSDLTTISTSAIKLNGYKLKIAARQHALPGTIDYGANALGEPGQIIWGNPATRLYLR